MLDEHSDSQSSSSVSSMKDVTAVMVLNWSMEMEEGHLEEPNLEANTEIDHWLTFSLGPLGCHGEFKNALDYLDDVLGPITFLVGDSITIADYVVFGTLFASGFWQVSIMFFLR